MTKITPSLLLATLIALFLHVASAQAQYVRTCVSMLRGDDANTCHCSQPCRTFTRAHGQTLSDGEITVLDPGDYGGLTITKSISINNDSAGEASITVSGGATGIIVNAPAAGYVNLRGITIQGVEFGGGVGLRLNTGMFLTMTNCVIRNHTGNGIEFFPTVSSNLALSNTLVADNGGTGIFVRPSGSGTVKAAFERVETYGNSFSGLSVSGLSSTGSVDATVTDSVAANNVDRGFIVLSDAAHAPTSLLVRRSVSANNRIGLSAVNGATATLRVGQSTVTGNTTSWTVSSGGVLRSYGDNNIDGNGDGDPAITVIATK